MKKCLLLFCLLLTSLGSMAYDAKIDGIYYNFNKTDHTAEVTYYDNYYSSNNRYAYSGSVVIPPNVTYYGITYRVTSIGYMAFEDCSGLTSVTSLIQEPFEISEGVFQYYYDGGYKFTSATLHVPKGTKEKYEVTAAWNEFQDIVEIGDVPTGIDAISHGEGDGAATVTERYALGGQRIGAGQRGLNIVRMSDGTVRKVVVK